MVRSRISGIDCIVRPREARQLSTPFCSKNLEKRSPRTGKIQWLSNPELDIKFRFLQHGLRLWSTWLKYKDPWCRTWDLLDRRLCCQYLHFWWVCLNGGVLTLCGVIHFRLQCMRHAIWAHRFDGLGGLWCLHLTNAGSLYGHISGTHEDNDRLQSPKDFIAAPEGTTTQVNS